MEEARQTTNNIIRKQLDQSNEPYIREILTDLSHAIETSVNEGEYSCHFGYLAQPDHNVNLVEYAVIAELQLYGYPRPSVGKSINPEGEVTQLTFTVSW